jgi:hypothetical protein
MAKYEGHNAQVAVTSDHMIVVVSISQSTRLATPTEFWSRTAAGYGPHSP